MSTATAIVKLTALEVNATRTARRSGTFAGARLAPRLVAPPESHRSTGNLVARVDLGAGRRCGEVVHPTCALAFVRRVVASPKQLSCVELVVVWSVPISVLLHRMDEGGERVSGHCRDPARRGSPDAKILRSPWSLVRRRRAS
ncbi:hypothetical protein [Metallibacterium scheffleri]|uniref:hypothetical protein n=1 Tax=Metallibacterium scheffleri TaxID=993689 RepID=UPI0023F325F7|nr:hypothetical protein [Metallibacterium scheffleri]